MSAILQRQFLRHERARGRTSEEDVELPPQPQTARAFSRQQSGEISMMIVMMITMIIMMMIIMTINISIVIMIITTIIMIITIVVRIIMIIVVQIITIIIRKSPSPGRRRSCPTRREAPDPPRPPTRPLSSGVSICYIILYNIML